MQLPQLVGKKYICFFKISSCEGTQALSDFTSLKRVEVTLQGFQETWRTFKYYIITSYIMWQQSEEHFTETKTRDPIYFVIIGQPPEADF